jgi:hypothetical protein
MSALYTDGIRLSPTSSYRHPRGTSLIIKDQISPSPSSKSGETCRYLHSSFHLRSESGDPGSDLRRLAEQRGFEIIQEYSDRAWIS